MIKHFFLLFVFSIISINGQAETRVFQATGSVSSVEVLKTYTTQKIPRNEFIKFYIGNTC